jgi:hypothetical protein
MRWPFRRALAWHGLRAHRLIERQNAEQQAAWEKKTGRRALPHRLH